MLCPGLGDPLCWEMRSSLALYLRVAGAAVEVECKGGPAWVSHHHAVQQKVRTRPVVLGVLDISRGKYPGAGHIQVGGEESKTRIDQLVRVCLEPLTQEPIFEIMMS